MMLFLLSSLFITVVIEVSVSILVGISSIKDLKKIILINCITNLLLNFIIYNLDNYLEFNLLFFLIIPVLEVIVFLVEGFYLKRIDYKKYNSFVLSLILNICSYGCGFICTLISLR